MSRWVRRCFWGVLLVVPVLQGCYVYRSADPADLVPGARVRARLAPAQAVRLEAFTTEGTRTLEGRVEGVAADSVLMAVTVHSALQGNRIRNLEQRVGVDPSGILDLEVRRLDRGRTVFLVGVGVVALGSAFLLSAEDEGRLPGPEPGEPNEARIPLFRFALPWF